MRQNQFLKKKYMHRLVIPIIFISMLFSLSLNFVCPANGANTSVLSNSVSTQLDAAAGKKGANYVKPTDPRLTAMFIIRILLTLLGTVFLAMTIYAGYLWMTAGGNEEQVTKSKKLLSQSIIGLIIVFSAYSITIFAFKVAVNYFADPLGGGGVYYQPEIPTK
jgi:hypothetical protein